MRSQGFSHIAMSVAPGTLTDAYRAELLDFYGSHFGWKEIESLRLPDRLTLSVGKRCYINVRERPEVMVCHGYEHIGLLVASTEDAETTWRHSTRNPTNVALEPMTRADDGYRAFRFRYLIPFTIEVQFFP